MKNIRYPVVSATGLQMCFIQTLASGADFLGWVHFPYHRILHTITKRRMIKRIRGHGGPEIIQSYLGLLKHGNAPKLSREIIFELDF